MTVNQGVILFNPVASPFLQEYLLTLGAACQYIIDKDNILCRFGQFIKNHNITIAATIDYKFNLG